MCNRQHAEVKDASQLTFLRAMDTQLNINVGLAIERQDNRFSSVFRSPGCSSVWILKTFERQVWTKVTWVKILLGITAGVGLDSSVGIATRYGLDDPGIKSRWEHFDCLTLEDRTDRLSRNVGKYQSTQRNVPEERRSQNQLMYHALTIVSVDEKPKYQNISPPQESDR